MATPILASGCICGTHMLEQANEGTCLKCGHGSAHSVLEQAYRLLASAAPRPARAAADADARVVPITSARSAHGLLRPHWTEDDCIVAYRRWEREHGKPPSSADWQQPKQRNERRPSNPVVYRLFGGWPAFRRAVAEVPRDEALAA